MNAIRPPAPPVSVDHYAPPSSEQMGEALVKGAAIGVLGIFPALMVVFGVAFAGNAAMLIGVAAGALFMSLLIGCQIGMGIWGGH
jgi:hypothetical protein